MKDHFLDRIYGEFMAYKASILCCSNSEIFGKCYEIDMIVNLYEILAERCERLSDEVLTALLNQKNILMGLYDEWLKKDDSNYSEIETHVSEELEVITSRYLKEQEAENGEKVLHNQ